LCVGRPRAASANASGSCGPAGPPTTGPGPVRGHSGRVGGRWPKQSRWDPRQRPWAALTQVAYDLSRPSDETQPRCGGTLGGVQRLHETLVPRTRPAPDGHQEGGTQPTDSSRSNRRGFLAPSRLRVKVNGRKTREKRDRLRPQLVELT